MQSRRSRNFAKYAGGPVATGRDAAAAERQKNRKKVQKFGADHKCPNYLAVGIRSTAIIWTGHRNLGGRRNLRDGRANERLATAATVRPRPATSPLPHVVPVDVRIRIPTHRAAVPSHPRKSPRPFCRPVHTPRRTNSALTSAGPVDKPRVTVRRKILRRAALLRRNFSLR